MVKFNLAVLVFSVLIVFSVTDPVPSYIKPCRVSAPDVNECVVKNGNQIIPSILKGDKKYRIPVLNPLKVDHINIEPSPNFHLQLTDALISGLERGKLTDANFQMDQNKLQVKIHVPKMIIDSNYAMTGRILVLPLEGSGHSIIDLNGGNYTYNIEFEYYKKNGKKHGKIKESSVTYNLESFGFNFDNLFNGNKELGETTNRFLNENWRDMGQELRPAVTTTVSTIADAVINGFLSKVPFDEIFLP